MTNSPLEMKDLLLSLGLSSGSNARFRDPSRPNEDWLEEPDDEVELTEMME